MSEREMSDYIKTSIQQKLWQLANKLEKAKATREEIADQMMEIIEQRVSYEVRRFESERLEEIKKHYADQLAEEAKKLEAKKRELVEADPKFLAASYAVEQANEAAHAETDQYTRTQLVRSIGLIWSSTFGLQQIGGGTPKQPDEE